MTIVISCSRYSFPSALRLSTSAWRCLNQKAWLLHTNLPTMTIILSCCSWYSRFYLFVVILLIPSLKPIYQIIQICCWILTIILVGDYHNSNTYQSSSVWERSKSKISTVFDKTGYFNIKRLWHCCFSAVHSVTEVEVRQWSFSKILRYIVPCNNSNKTRSGLLGLR